MENFDTQVCKKLKSGCFNGEWQECSQYGNVGAQSAIHTYVNRTVMLDHPGEWKRESFSPVKGMQKILKQSFFITSDSIPMGKQGQHIRFGSVMEI